MPGDDGPQIVDAYGAMDFTRVTTVPQSEDLIDQAFAQASKSSAPKGRPGEEGRNRELARVGTAARTLESRLHRVVREFPSFEKLHPFYHELVDVIAGIDDLKSRLGSVEWARKQVQKIRAEAENRIRDTENNHEAMLARKEAYGRMASVVEEVTEDLAHLEEVRYELSGLPTLMFERPVLVLAGYPNVGKSSLLRHMTRADPEIAPYPFTTKGVALGHVDHEHYTVQIMDTPGLLDRPIEDRNAIERQAIGALTHAADATLFILDPSEHCGYHLDEQTNLLDSVRELFEDAEILVVENKSDLATTGEYPAMSCETGDGVDEVATRALDAAVDGFRDRAEPAWLDDASPEPGGGSDVEFPGP